MTISTKLTSKYDITRIFDQFNRNVPSVDEDPSPEDYDLSEGWEVGLEE